MGGVAGNVIPIGSTARDRDPGQRILRETGDRLCKLLLDWLNGVGDEIAEDFFVLADGTSDRLAQTRYLDLRNAVQKKWPQMVDAFLEAFHRGGSTPTLYIKPDFSSLELVDDGKLSENIVIREFSARLAETCNEELYGLDRRVALLLGEEDCDKIDNPLGPRVICESLADACNALTEASEERVLLLRRVERHLHAAQPGIYRSLNQHLIDLDILPDLKRSYRRAGGGSQPTPAPSAQSATHSGPLPLDNNIFGALQRLVAARGGNLSPLPAISGVPAIAASAAEGQMVPAADALALSNAFFSSLEHFRPSDGNSLVNQIHAIRSSEAAKKVGHVEAVTIDIVAMLFDFVFNDKHVSNGVKALVGRLQIPVLKVAMLDQSFFANRSHPARRFLDEISGISLRWGGNIDQNDPFYKTLAQLIDRIQDEFECDVEVFSRVLEELQTFVNTHEREEEATTRVAAEVASRRERESAAWERAQAVIRTQAPTAAPGVITEFFREQWVEVLQKIAVTQGEDNAHWKDAIQLMADLAQSVMPKKKPEERMALISSLPALLSRINRGLDLVSGDKTARRPFFDALVDLHTAALKGDSLPAAKPAPEKAPPASTEPLHPEGDIIITRSIANGVEVEEVTLVGAKPVWRADDREVARQVADLKRGDWVEFRQEDGTSVRERLTWISPQRHILVFSNHRAAKAISISPDALAKKIREGQAAIVSDESLFDRAMSGVLESLNAA